MHCSKTLIVTAALLLQLAPRGAEAEMVMNGSFETSTRGTGAGYLSQSGNSVGTWTASDNSRAGIQRTDAGSNPFANNGTTPAGNAVGFLQAVSASPTVTYSNSITGLTVGQEYEISYRVNSRQVPGLPTPSATLSVGGTVIVGANVNPVGGSAPYKTIVRSFTATATSMPLAVTAGLATGTDATLLVDDFQVVQKASPWSVNAWTGDATSGIDTSLNTYTHAFNFGTGASSADATINGQLFAGIGGANPSQAGSFSLTDVPNAGDDLGNNISSGGSDSLADGFVFGGTNSMLTLEGLTVGQEYTTSLFTVGFDASAFRTSTFGSDGDMISLDVNEFGNNNGLRLDYTYTATGSTKVISYSPLQSGSTFHLYGFANAVAVPEPSSLALFGIAGCGVVLHRRRVSKNS